MQDLTVTLVQTNLAWKNPGENLDKFTGIIENLQGRRDLIILPEMFTTGFVVEPEGVAESMEGPSIQWLKVMSEKHQCAITGSLIIEEHGKYFNRMIWMMPSGDYLWYDKRHLFSMANEQYHFSRGNKKLVIEYLGWKIHPLICYDLRFPVWSKNTWSEGHFEYDCLIVIANWPSVRRHAWRSLLVARAIENMAYVIGVNRIGRDGQGKSHSGETVMIDPLGFSLLRLRSGKDVAGTMTMSYPNLHDIRDHFGFAKDWDHFRLID